MRAPCVHAAAQCKVPQHSTPRHAAARSHARTVHVQLHTRTCRYPVGACGRHRGAAAAAARHMHGLRSRVRRRYPESEPQLKPRWPTPPRGKHYVPERTNYIPERNYIVERKDYVPEPHCPTMHLHDTARRSTVRPPDPRTAAYTHAPAATQLMLRGGTVLLLLEPELASGVNSTSLVLTAAAAVALYPRSSWYCTKQKQGARITGEGRMPAPHRRMPCPIPTCRLGARCSRMQ